MVFKVKCLLYVNVLLTEVSIMSYCEPTLTLKNVYRRCYYHITTVKHLHVFQFMQHFNCEPCLDISKCL